MSNAILVVKEGLCFGGGALHKHMLCKVSTNYSSEGLSKNCVSQSTVVAE